MILLKLLGQVFVWCVIYPIAMIWATVSPRTLEDAIKKMDAWMMKKDAEAHQTETQKKFNAEYNHEA